MTDPVSTLVVSALAKKAVKTIVKSSLAENVWNGVVDFLAEQAKDLGKDEIKNRILSLIRLGKKSE